MVDLATKLASVMVAEEQRQPYQAAQNQLTVERDGEGGARITELAAERLNLLGDEGWELVNVFDTNMLHGRTRDVVAVLKRPRR